MKRLFFCCLLAALLLALPVGAEERSLAWPATQTVWINGQAVELQAYALKNDLGYLTNYVKIRDMAAALDNTTARFEVTWDKGVRIQTHRAYRSRNGQENQAPYSGPMPYYYTITPTWVDGKAVEVDAFVLTDEAGNGSTYYKLRDLARALDFSVFWENEAEGVRIDTSIPYRPA